MFGGPPHAHLHLPGEAGGQVGAHAGLRRDARFPAEPRRPQCAFPLAFALWGSLSAREHRHVRSARPWPCSLSALGGLRGLAGNVQGATAADKESRRGTIKLTRGARQPAEA